MNPYEKIQTPTTAFSKARTNLLVNHPFFGALSMRLKAVEAPEYETMATDGEHVFFNPAYLQTLNFDELTGLVAHEVLHLAMKHHERRDGRDKGRWNTACDYAINPIILEAGLSLPEGYLTCEMYHDKSAEEIYALLPQGGDDGGNGSGVGSGGGGNEASRQEDGKPNPDANPDQPGSGEAAQQPPDPSKMGQVLDRPKDAPASATGESWETALTQAARIAEKAGKLPGSLKRVVKEITRPTLPWESLLRKFMTGVSRDDFDWTRPNRRFIAQGLYLPGCYSERIDHMVVAIDTSGSIKQDVLDAFMAEVNGIREEVDCARVTMLQCNTRLGETKVFEEGQRLTVDHITGGGGTLFSPVFDWLKTNGSGVECMAYFTDLKVRQIPQDPGIPVLWAEPAHNPGFINDPKYGQRISIKPKEEA